MNPLLLVGIQATRTAYDCLLKIFLFGFNKNVLQKCKALVMERNSLEVAS